jgi:hypothetical protein
MKVKEIISKLEEVRAVKKGGSNTPNKPVGEELTTMLEGLKSIPSKSKSLSRRITQKLYVEEFGEKNSEKFSKDMLKISTKAFKLIVEVKAARNNLFYKKKR